MEYKGEKFEHENKIDTIEEIIHNASNVFTFELEKIIITKMINLLYRYVSENLHKSIAVTEDLIEVLEKYESKLKTVTEKNWRTAVPLDMSTKLTKFSESEGFHFVVNEPPTDYSSFKEDGNYQFIAKLKVNEITVDLGHMVETPPVYTPAQKYFRAVISI